MGRLSLYLLGGFQIQLEGQGLERVLPLKGEALLAYLAMERGAQRRDKLAGLLWPDCSEAQAHHNLSQALYSTRKALALSPGETSMILGDALEVQLNPQAEVWVDAREFSALLEANERHTHPSTNTCPECFKRLQQSKVLYRGGFLEDFSLHNVIPFDEWRLVQRERLQRQHVLVLQQMAEHHAARGEMKRALELAWQRVELDPLGEAAHRQLMRLLSEGGQRSQALAHFHALQHTLQDSLGVVPDAETLALVESIQTQERTSSPEQSHSHLPQPLTPFIGREEELAELCSLLRDPHRRLISVLGTGGSGKTRLALQAARAVGADYPDGVYLVPLSSLSASESLIPVVASALGLSLQEQGSASARPPQDQEAQLREYLRGKQLLLLFDSFETVLEGASWLAELLRTATQVKALVTTRARLNVRGEQLFSLSGMDYPEEGEPLDATQYSAMALFLSGARRAHAGFELSAANMAEVARICRLVEGMPLGVLLAATWVEACTTAEIAAQIEASLDFLSSDWADVPTRQRSLRATLDYSWRMLSEAEGEAFWKLSVFTGIFSHQVAQQVCGIGPHLLRSLVDKSMLQVDSNGNYRMHDLLHQYGEEKLAVEPSVGGSLRKRHAAYYLRQLPTKGSELKSARQRQTLEELDLMNNDIQAAWEWAAGQGEVELLEGAVEGLCRYYSLRCRFQEGKSACRLALEHLERVMQNGIERLSLRGWLLAWQAEFCNQLGEVELGKQLRETGWEILRQAETAGQDVRRIQVLIFGMRANSATDLRQQLDGFRKVAALYQELDEPWGQASALCQAGNYATNLGEHTLALKLHQEAVELSRKVGEPHRLGISLESLAYDHLILGQWEDGSRLMHEAAASFMAAGDLWATARAKLHLGVMLGWTGHLVEARQIVELSLPLLRQAGYRSDIVYGTLALGTGEMGLGEYTQAEHTLQVAVEAARQDGFVREQAFCLAMLGLVALIQGEVPRALTRVDESISIYRGIQAAGELGMALGVLFLVQRNLGRDEPARAALKEALRIAVGTKSRFTVITLSTALVVFLLDAGKVELALQSYAAARQVPMVACWRWFEDISGQELQAKMTSLPPEVRQAAEQQSGETDIFDLFARILAELER